MSFPTADSTFAPKPVARRGRSLVPSRNAGSSETSSWGPLTLYREGPLLRYFAWQRLALEPTDETLSVVRDDSNFQKVRRFYTYV